MEYQDKVLKCIDCGTEFVFTAGEQLFFRDKKFTNEPKRCKNCKDKRVAVLGAASHGSPSHGPSRGHSKMTIASCSCSFARCRPAGRGRPARTGGPPHYLFPDHAT
jgi:DNA-directed RNA polymerase subunit RPC12/RpoP